MALVLVVGCGKKTDEQSSDPAPKAATKPAVAAEGEEAKAPAAEPERYTVRGVFKAYDEASKQMAIQHEAIPDFKNREGEKVGMMTMQMSFRTGEGVDAKSLTAEDKIQFEFVVEWDQKPAIKVLKFEKLPAETELEL